MSRGFHQLASEAVLEATGSRAEGLSASEAEQRLREHGENRLETHHSPSPWRLLAGQLFNLLTLILIVSAAISMVIGDVVEAVAILVIVVLAALLGFVQELRAARELDALRELATPTARVIRDGHLATVGAPTVVVGDVLALETGDIVAADARLLAAHDLRADEAVLTGESLPVHKQLAPLDDDDAGALPVADRSNMVFAGTAVVHGRARAVIVATGMQTAFGEVARLLAAQKPPPTPLTRELHRLGRSLGIGALLLAALLAAAGVLRGHGVLSMLVWGVALAVAVIPEALPAVVTISLALGVKRMSRHRALVRQLPAVETLGATTVICSDKTGTLTSGRMAAREVLLPERRDGDEDDDARAREQRLWIAAALCNNAELDAKAEIVGEATEVALLEGAQRAGIDIAALRARHARRAQLSFSSERKRMSTLHDDAPCGGGGADANANTNADGERGALLVSKGAPEVLLARCTLDEAQHARISAQLEALAQRGLRTIALAQRQLPDVGDKLDEEAEHDLTYLGCVGLADPPREEAAEAIARCRTAGVRTIMITGDHADTAAAIARELGIIDDKRQRVLRGAELSRLDDDALDALVDEVAVFARVDPAHKLRIVEALQRRGEVVAMTGDGVNDAPALRNADIGVAMGITGTEVTKEAADMVLTDDNFATIVKAVREGRTIYDNIVKFVRFQLSTNLGAIMSLVGAQVVGLPTPFTAIQVLWINLIMDGPPAMALGVDPPAGDTMERRPRDPKATILSGRRLGVLVAYGVVMAAGTLGVLTWSKSNSSEAHALALAFTTFVLFQVFNVFNARAERASVFRRELFTNWKLWAAIGGVLVLQVAAVHFDPVQEVFGTADLAVSDWLVAVGVASTILWFDEARKLVVRRRAA
ncbi:MAG: cation-transporting P-type ATPase [Acidimicrobiales bacterium]|nr:cation-transporting P-type ATPase [Acidimicrobiales bacterium]